MKWLINLFTAHPRSVGETYWQHLFVASKISARLSIACSSQLIHGVLPFIKPPFKSDVKSLSLFLKEMDAEVRKQKIN
jgi:predicted HD phosphohydrolase